MLMITRIAVVGASLLALGANPVFAGSDQSHNECPVGLVKGKTLYEEFGYGSEELTRCIERRTNVKLVIQDNRFCRDNVSNADCASGRGYALAQARNMVDDYEITHGMQAGVDYEMVIVAHDGGGYHMLKNRDFNDGPLNQFQGDVEYLLGKGVKFYFCQNTVRGFKKNGVFLDPNNPTAELIDGVQYVTGGLTAISDFQHLGYAYIQP